RDHLFAFQHLYPFEGGGLPWISVCDLASKHTPEKIDQEEELPNHQRDGSKGNEALHWQKLLQVRRRANQLRVSPRMTGQSQNVHRNKRGVRAQEAEPEMHFAQALVH